jgi:hypothetical protein
MRYRTSVENNPPDERVARPHVNRKMPGAMDRAL